jgi:hypothetical protein
MIGQYLPQTNKSVTVAKSKKKRPDSLGSTSSRYLLYLKTIFKKGLMLIMNHDANLPSGSYARKIQRVTSFVRLPETG